MNEVVFLTINEVMEIHDEQIQLYGGESGVRDATLLDSALASPKAGAAGEYFHATVFEMAAAYLYHVVQNHPFVDGNKRTGLACAYLFLSINGYELECDSDELADMVFEVAKGSLDKAGITKFICQYSIKSTM
jgi:death-on-curing family protein